MRQVDDGRELGGWNEDVGMALADGDLSKDHCNVRLWLKDQASNSVVLLLVSIYGNYLVGLNRPQSIV